MMQVGAVDMVCDMKFNGDTKAFMIRDKSTRLFPAQYLVFGPGTPEPLPVLSTRHSRGRRLPTLTRGVIVGVWCLFKM